MQDKLVNLRKVYGVRQNELAIYLDITLKTYRNKEKGISQFTANEMFKLAQYFRKPLEDIFLPTTYQNGKSARTDITDMENDISCESLPN